MRRTEARSRESTGQISVARPLLATKSTQRGCVSQTISALGNDARKPATAGKVCTISPREPRRTTTKRGSAMGAFADGVEKGAGGMVFGIAYDGYTDAEPIGDGAFGNSFGGVVGAFGVNVRSKLLKQLLDVWFGEEQDEIDIAQGGDQLRAGLFVEDWPTVAF